ncbi:MAG: hypothetical protein HXY24_12605 [Rubrivivax sp.]|nr:hypothetical protein [Rubrivivax sp.]
MRKRTLIAASALFLVHGFIPVRPADAQELSRLLRQKADALKQSIASNQQALRQYTWIEKTEFSLKGDLKSTKIESCRYAPDGSIQKTLLSEPEEQKKKRGLRGKIAAKKTKEVEDYMDRSVSLIGRYVPPSPDRLKAAADAGKVTISQAGPGTLQLQFRDYFKNGDSVTFTVDSEAKVIRQLNVDSYLSDAADKVTLDVQFQTLPDATNRVTGKVLKIAAKEIVVNIVDSNYQKLAR